MPEREIRHRCIQTQGGASCETVNSFISTFSPPAAGHRWGIIRFLSPQFKVKPLPVVTTERRLHPYVLTAIPQSLPPKNENTVSGSQLMLVGTSCQRRQLTVWVGMGERWGPSFPKHTLPSHSQLPRWRPRAWAVSPDVLHRLGFHLALRRRRTRGVFGVKQIYFHQVTSHQPNRQTQC